MVLFFLWMFPREVLGIAIALFITVFTWTERETTVAVELCRAHRVAGVQAVIFTQIRGAEVRVGVTRPVDQLHDRAALYKFAVRRGVV